MKPTERSIKSTAMHVLGIDAGGTKTVCLLADGSGRHRGRREARAPTCRPPANAAVEQVLRDVSRKARSATAASPGRGRASASPASDRDDEARSDVARIMRRTRAASSRVLVVNDALIALVAGARDEPGIVIIAGTGSIVYGRNAANRGRARGRLGPHDRRRGERVLDRPRGAGRGDARRRTAAARRRA